jgi:WD40 repeat protein
MRLFDLRDPSHFTVLFESKLKTPILHSAVNEHCLHQVAVLNQRSGIVNVLDTRKPKLVQAELEHRSQPNHLAWYPNSSLLSTACEDSQLQIWKVGELD